MIKNIVHLADYHIHNDKWHDRYEIGNEFIYKKIKEIAPDRIVIVGDLFENFIQISNEAKLFAGKFLNNLTNLTEKLIIVPGNHDIRKKDLNRKNSVQTIVELLNNPKIVYWDKSGFYEDENVVWVNHSHLEKHINPWKDIPHQRDKNKIYIDLWHDPVNGCVADNGYKIESKLYRNLSDFKGDFGFFGDIHKFQYLNKDKTFAYCSSTFQQTMGEDVEMHGFIVWDILNKTSEFIVVPDEYKLITFTTHENFDYDNIHFDHPLATKKSQFRVIWRDYSSNINNENEEKIKNYISSKWNDNIKIEKERIYTKITAVQKLTESININDKHIQQEIFKEYLKANNYDDAFINEILKIDNIINDRLDVAQTPFGNNIEWSIDRIWVKNFKSYDHFDLYLKDAKGIIQIGGENQQGKTTILDAITYVVYGTTLSTNKLGGAQREKFADNRYINNKRNLNFCEGGVVITVNNKQYTIVRKTERKLSKDKKTIVSCSTDVEYYEGATVDENKKLRGEVKTQTQQMIDAILGSFEDFVRMALTNSENLNYLISLDRATFIDSVIRDAGYDIFEKKLEEFKKYKKEIDTERIELDINKAEEELNNLKLTLENNKVDYTNIKKIISDINEQIKTISNEKDDEIKKLNKIDDDIINFNIEEAHNKINEYKNSIEKNMQKQKENIEKQKILRNTYDKNAYEDLLNNIKSIDENIFDLKLQISKIENEINDKQNKITKIDSKMESLKSEVLNSKKQEVIIINNEIDKLKYEIKNTIEKKIYEIEDLYKSQEFKIKTILNNMNTIKEKLLSYKNEINTLKNSDVCPTCGALPEHQRHKLEKIKELKDNYTELFNKYKNFENELKESKLEAEAIKTQLENIKENKVYPNDLQEKIHTINLEIQNKESIIEKINHVCKEIENGNYDIVPDLKSKNDMAKKMKDDLTKEIENCKTNITLLLNEINNKENEKLNIQNKLNEFKKIIEEVEIYEQLEKENNEINLKNEYAKLAIENIKVKIDKYYKQLKYIEENKMIEENINKLKEKIHQLESQKNEYTEKIMSINNESTLIKNKIVEIKNKIEKYKEQIKRDEILKEYMKCVHRDGIPTYLLQKSRELINIELEDLLSNVDFNVFFDEYLNLKLYMKNTPWAIQNLLESSGSERSFGAVALKMALRSINNRSKPNFLMLDEVMMRLKGHMVEKFNNMLVDMKKKIDKIFIIEHVHEIPFDIYIEVTKNRDGVSSLKCH